MLYMIIERFHPGKVKTLYERFEAEGRHMPEGLHYVNSWVDRNVSTCFQVMETEDVGLLHEWIFAWNDMADFEVIPVITSAEARAKVLPKSTASPSTA